MKSTIDDDVDGLIIPPNDPEACKNALLRIAREPELRHRLIRNGLKRAQSQTLESFAAEVISELDILAGLVRRRKDLSPELPLLRAGGESEYLQ